ncbi:MAG: YbhB/YbcL family Raf kinase inhibitor-like protein [Bacteroidota bacterium]|nr:YbhB/YbcL family Raf kinase inhibitor-like protein [Bacteroidota bacterium]
MKKHSEATSVIDFKKLLISCPAFKENDFIPARYTCDGKNINPPLAIDHIPEETKSLAIIMDDPDAPVGTWVHWVVWNIPVTHHIKEDHVPGKEGKNDFLRHHYGGPCPPSGTHRYFFKVYALDTILDIPDNADKAGLEKAMSGHITGFGELIALYKRKN